MTAADRPSVTDYPDASEVLDVIYEVGYAASSTVRRRLGLTFRQAEDVLAALGRCGVVGNAEGTAARKILVTRPEAEVILGMDDPEAMAPEVPAQAHPRPSAYQQGLAAGRAETTTATTEDAEEVLHGAGWFARADLDPRDLRGILHDLADANLLATARARPTRDELAKVICESRCSPQRKSWLETADAVLALLADQPTEAEAGARALERAAEQTYTKSNAQWLRDRAASLRGGER